MDRQVKFRAKQVDNGEWVYGDLLQPNYERFLKNKDIGNFLDEYKISILEKDFIRNDYVIDPETIGQFTGLYDKNGKEIYENDIVEWAGYTMKIVWGEDCGVGYGFIWEPCGNNIDYVESMTGFIDEYEVIGNIYDNPELLKGE